MRFLKQNLAYKLLALALALALRTYAGKQENLTEKPLRVPFTLQEPPDMRLLVPETGARQEVKVRLFGPKEVVDAIDADKLEVTTDPLSGLPPDKESPVRIHVKRPVQFENDQRLQITYSPHRIVVKLGKNARRDVPVTVVPEQRLEGWDLVGPPRATPEAVVVTGADPAVRRVAAVVARISLEGKEHVSASPPLEAQDENGADITELVRLRPAQVQVTATLRRTVAQRQALVEPIFVVPPGYRAAVEVTPDRIRVQGPERVIRDVYTVETVPIPLAPGDDDVTRTVAIVPPQDDARSPLKLVPQQVTVKIRLTPITAGGGAASPETKAASPRPAPAKPPG
jgi:YbbR domain-containing protein